MPACPRCLALQVQEALQRDPHAGDLYVFRGVSGNLIKILWRDGIGMSLYPKRLEKGRFVWPSPSGGVLTISTSQLACMPDGIYLAEPGSYLPTGECGIKAGVFIF